MRFVIAHSPVHQVSLVRLVTHEVRLAVSQWFPSASALPMRSSIT
jgi:hypothetical protein